MNYTVVFGGASITDDLAWPTWKSYCEERYNLTDSVNCANKGIGNKTILSRCYYAAKQVNNPLIVVMLTAFDKWDWYLPNNEAVEKYQKEKNKVIRIGNADNLGVWGTGSHFPLEKQYYKENYFNQTFHTLENLIYINWFAQTCKQNNWQFCFLLDSPIFDYYEHEINQAQNVTVQSNRIISSSPLLDNPYQDIKGYFDYLGGIIGFASENSIPWKHTKFGAHPGSMVHYEFSKQHVFPLLDQYFETQRNIDTDQVSIEQKFWEKSDRL